MPSSHVKIFMMTKNVRTRNFRVTTSTPFSKIKRVVNTHLC